MKGYFIDSENRTIQEREYQYGDVGRIIGKGADFLIDLGWRWRNGDVLFVDDEGLLKPQEHWFCVLDRPDRQPMGGNGFITGPDNVHGSSDPPGMTLEQAAAAIEFLTRDQMKAWVRGRHNQPAVLHNGVPVASWEQLFREGGNYP